VERDEKERSDKNFNNKTRNKYFFCVPNKNSVLHYMAVSYDFRDLDQQFTAVFTKREVLIKIHILYHHRRSRQ